MQEADENGSDGLDIDEFRTAFGQILGKGKKDQQVGINNHFSWLNVCYCIFCNVFMELLWRVICRWQ